MEEKTLHPSLLKTCSRTRNSVPISTKQTSEPVLGKRDRSPSAHSLTTCCIHCMQYLYPYLSSHLLTIRKKYFFARTKGLTQQRHENAISWTFLYVREASSTELLHDSQHQFFGRTYCPNSNTFSFQSSYQLVYT
jgi:hypothetical protein